LKFPQPLDSKTIRRTNPEDGKGVSDLPLTDAGPGFRGGTGINHPPARLNVFPEGKGLFQRRQWPIHGPKQKRAPQISAKNFLRPRDGFSNRSAASRWSKAVDDKGRTIAPVESDEGRRSRGGFFRWIPPARAKSESLSIQLALGLPATDAQAINEVDAEAVAVTRRHLEKQCR